MPEGSGDPLMADSGAPPSSLRPLTVLIATIAVVGALYLAQAVLIPIALAILITFILSPLVSILERWKLKRVPAVIMLVVLVFSALGELGWIMTVQFSNLSSELPRYQTNIREKVRQLRSAITYHFNLKKMEEAVKEVQEGERPPPRSGEEVPAGSAPPKGEVVVKNDKGSAITSVPGTLVSILKPLASAGLVIVLVIFMLIQREDLRNRFLRLFGYGRLTDATRALDEAAHRISRYLLMQSIINGTFGLGVGAGLFFIGLPYSLLWGILAAFLRFIPYVGTLIAALLPLALAFAHFQGWLELFLIGMVFTVLELVNYMIMEPLLYGRSAGVSPVAILVSVAFWTWLWGPIGLLLATPLTVCLVVLGRHVPPLRFVDVLMGDQPVIEPKVILYQRLLSRDLDEATSIVEEYLEKSPREKVYDEILVPALNNARLDLSQRKLTGEDMQVIVDLARRIVEDLTTRPAQPAAAAPGGPRLLLLGCPAQDEADELALEMFQDLLPLRGYEMEIISASVLTSEILSMAAEKKPRLILIASLPPGGLAPTRYILKRLKRRHPSLKLVVGRWGAVANLERNHQLLKAAGADQIATTLLESRGQVELLSQLSPVAEPEAAPHRR
jgi:predicted PurR-regulated permease PerM